MSTSLKNEELAGSDQRDLHIEIIVGSTLVPASSNGAMLEIQEGIGIRSS